MSIGKVGCVQCGSASKYKCPVCRQPYCSVTCCKKHKEAPCEPPIPETAVEETHQREYDYPTVDTVPLDMLKLLEESEGLKKCLENPHLRAILENLDISAHPDELMQDCMQEPIFVEFVDECLKIVQPQEGCNDKK